MTKVRSRDTVRNRVRVGNRNRAFARFGVRTKVRSRDSPHISLQ